VTIVTWKRESPRKRRLSRSEGVIVRSSLQVQGAGQQGSREKARRQTGRTYSTQRINTVAHGATGKMVPHARGQAVWEHCGEDFLQLDSGEYTEYTQITQPALGSVQQLPHESGA
jgi:hypothetical protein